MTPGPIIRAVSARIVVQLGLVVSLDRSLTRLVSVTTAVLIVKGVAATIAVMVVPG